MRKYTLLFLLAVSFNSLSCQSIVYYLELTPTVNQIQNEEAINRVFLFFHAGGTLANKEETILLFNLCNNNEMTLTDKIIGFNSDEFLLSFWNPYNGDNYCYLLHDNNATLRGSGWHKIDFNIENLTLSFTDINTSLFQNRRTPPVVSLQDYNYDLLVDYRYNDNGNRLYSQETKIVDVKTNETIWESSSQTENNWHPFKNVYWISGEWLFIEDMIMTSMLDDEQANYNLFNFISEEMKSFYPDKIIGYGRGYIITTSEDFYGITIQSPEGHVLFKDDKFDLVGMLRDTIFPVPYIDMAYFDSPYVYYTVYNENSGITPYCSVIVDLENLKSYRTTDERASILGIF